MITVFIHCMKLVSLNINYLYLLQKKIQKLVCMGTLKEKESFGEISVLLQLPFTCTIITGEEVEMAIIEDKDIFGKYIHLFCTILFDEFLISMNVFHRIIRTQVSVCVYILFTETR